MRCIADELEKEREELITKQVRLTNFFDDEKFKSLGAMQQELLFEQESIMLNYIRVLGKRIRLLKDSH